MTKLLVSGCFRSNGGGICKQLDKPNDDLHSRMQIAMYVTSEGLFTPAAERCCMRLAAAVGAIQWTRYSKGSARDLSIWLFNHINGKSARSA